MMPEGINECYDRIITIAGQRRLKDLGFSGHSGGNRSAEAEVVLQLMSQSSTSEIAKMELP